MLDPATVVLLTSSARLALQTAMSFWKATGQTEAEFDTWYKKERAEFYADDEATLPDV